MPGSGIAMAVHESSSGLRSLLCPGPTGGFSKAISRAVLEKHKIYPHKIANRLEVLDGGFLSQATASNHPLPAGL